MFHGIRAKPQKAVMINRQNAKFWLGRAQVRLSETSARVETALWAALKPCKETVPVFLAHVEQYINSNKLAEDLVRGEGRVTLEVLVAMMTDETALMGLGVLMGDGGMSKLKVECTKAFWACDDFLERLMDTFEGIVEEDVETKGTATV